MKQLRKDTLGTYGLVIVALFWGLGFPALKVVSGSIPAFYLIGLRFSTAAVLLAIIFWRRFKKINKALIRSAFILSIFLFLTYAFATLGINYTTSAKASFFSCLGLLIVPLIMRLMYKEKIKRRVAVSIGLCTAGLFLISYTSGMGFSLSYGDIICLGCSITGAFHLVITGRVAKDRDPVLLATIQLFFISAWAFFTAFFFEDYPSAVPGFHWAVLLYLALCATAVTSVLQNACQRYINPSRVGVILALEPVSGALFSALLLGDHLGISGIAGGALIFSSLIYMESGEKKAAASKEAADAPVNQATENMPLQESPERFDTSRRP